jgi:glycosyltransferase involved in cell wall biosynthesis
MINKRILHIIPTLSPGGASRSAIAVAKYSSAYGNFNHDIISLTQADRNAVKLAKESGISFWGTLSFPEILNKVNKYDIVHLHFWNAPKLYSFLYSDLPPCRLITWFHVAGDSAPQIIIRKLLEFSDIAVPCNPYSYNLELIKKYKSEYKDRCHMVYASPDFARLSGLKRRKTPKFNVGYIGTVDFVKMHPNYVSMSQKIGIDNVEFIVCGVGSALPTLQNQVTNFNATNKFKFLGHVEDIKSVIEVFDVYGYPLCEDTYAAAELNLQEVMYAGVPPVVFPYGGVKSLVINNETGLIVHSEFEYQQAIEYLYHNPQERQRLGNNAHDYAVEYFGAENAARQLNPIYDKLLQQPKRLRTWGGPAGASLLDQPVTSSDITGYLKPRSGVESFIESLGDTAPQFSTSFTSDNLQDIWAAEQNISESSPLLQSPASGGILHYRLYYPNDAYLRLWSGLVFRNQGQLKQAASEFHEAARLGFPHWRIFWYFAESVIKLGQLKLAEEALKKVLDSAPDFQPAKELLDRIAMSLKPSQTSQLGFPKIKPLVSKPNRPFWSVMLPTFKKLEYLEQTLQSVLQQLPESPQVQIEVVNDNPDRSLQDKMEALVKRVGGDRVSFYRHTEDDIGQTAIFNLCIERAKGDWVHLLHDDDLVLPGFYQALEPVLSQNPQIGAAFCRHRYIDEHDNELFLSALERESPGILENWLERIIVSQRIQPSSIVVQRKAYETLGGFCPEAKSAADWEMWKRISVHFPIWYEPKILACYRLHSLSWSSRLIETGGNIADTRATIEITQRYLPAHLASTLSQQALEHYAQYALREAHKQLQLRNREAAQAQIQEALKCSQSPQVQAVANHLLKALPAETPSNSLALTDPSAFLNQVSIQLNAYRQNPQNPQALEALRKLRYELAQACLELPPEQLLNPKAHPLAQAHALLRGSILKSEPLGT